MLNSAEESETVNRDTSERDQAEVTLSSIFLSASANRTFIGAI